MKTKVPTAEEALQAVVRNILGEPEPYTSATRFEDDLGADSLDVTEIVIDVEHEFAVLVPDEAVPTLKTFGDVMVWLRANADLSGYTE